MGRTKMVSAALAALALGGLPSDVFASSARAVSDRERRRPVVDSRLLLQRVGDAACTGAEMAAKRKAWAKAKPRPANASKKSRARRAGGGGR